MPKIEKSLAREAARQTARRRVGMGGNAFGRLVAARGENERLARVLTGRPARVGRRARRATRR